MKSSIKKDQALTNRGRLVAGKWRQCTQTTIKTYKKLQTIIGNRVYQIEERISDINNRNLEMTQGTKRDN